MVASRIGGIPELVEDGVTGFLVPPGDAAALAERLEALAGDRALLAKLGARCLERARELSLERTVERLVDIYRAVARAPGRPSGA